MRLNGQEIKGANVEVLVLRRNEGRDNIVLRFVAIPSFDPFNKLCKEPKPPVVMKPGGMKEFNTSDPNYKKGMQAFYQRHFSWITLESLRLGNPELEWDKVDYEKPDTWPLFEEELTEAGFSQAEIGQINRMARIANALDEEALDEARASFLASLREAETLSSQRDEQNSTPSGEAASD